MLLDIMISTLIFAFCIALGQLFMFLDSFAYWLLPLFILLLILSKPCYTENCKTLERKDFLITIAFTILASYIFLYQEIILSFGSICYLYLCIFIADIAFATSIRYKSLM